MKLSKSETEKVEETETGVELLMMIEEGIGIEEVILTLTFGIGLSHYFSDGKNEGFSTGYVSGTIALFGLYKLYT